MPTPMPNILVYGPPEKFKVIRDFIPCVASYKRTVCAFKYANNTLRDEAWAAITIMGFDTSGKNRDVLKSDMTATIYIATKLMEDSE